MAIITSESEFADAVSRKTTPIEINTDITLTKNYILDYELTITSDNPPTISWDGTNQELFTVTAPLTMNNILLDGTYKDVTLVSINDTTFNATNCTFMNVKSTTANKAFVTSGVNNDSTLNGCQIRNIQSDAAISTSDGTLTLLDTEIHDNFARGIDCTGTIINLGGTSKVNNNSASSAAGILANSGTIHMGLTEGDSPEISNNESTSEDAGGIYLDSSSTMIMDYNSIIANNSSSTSGGGIGMNSGTLILKGNASIEQNEAISSGGGIFAQGLSQITISEDANISDNVVNMDTGLGGAIYIKEPANLVIIGDVTISDNTAASGGAIYCTANTTTTIGETIDDAPTITYNNATKAGGGIFIADGALVTIQGSTLLENNVAGEGQGLCNEGYFQVAQSLQILDGVCFSYAPPEEEEAKIASITVNAPIIIDSLSDDAQIQLEPSDYLHPDNIPLTVAATNGTYQPLITTDALAFVPPATLDNHIIYRSADSSQVLVGIAVTFDDVGLTIIRID